MRLLIAGLLAALIALQLRLWLSDDGFREVWRLRTQVEIRTLENRRLAERNAALAAEVQDLKRGRDAAEERARNELGMLRPNETFFRVIPNQSGGGPAPAQ
jgi:cell division protein FtsB